MALPTPCADWDLATLLAHLSDSMADLEAAIRTGTLDLERPLDQAVGDPVETCNRQLSCCASLTGYDGPRISWPWAAYNHHPGGGH